MPAAEPRPWLAAPLNLTELRAAVIVPGGLWTDVRVVAETGSTNADVLSEASRGAPEGLVLAAEAQTAGRGRRGRSWLSLPGAALTFSVLLRPHSVPQPVRGWVPLLAGVAVAAGLRRVTSLDASLKWPNDVLVGGGKLAGILAEQAGDAIVVGIGINVRGREQDLPVATATSLELHGVGRTDRTELLAAVLGELESWYRRWYRTGTAIGSRGDDARRARAGSGAAAGPGDAEASRLREAYLRLSATVGHEVQVGLPGGQLLTGTACDVDGTGRLILRSGGDLVAVSAGDVIHVR